MKVAVWMGGTTAEREISLQTGEAVLAALASKGHSATPVDVQDELAALAHPATQAAEVVFVALHGGSGEDGRVQALLDLAHKPYTGAGPGSCAISMDKLWTKHICRSLGVPTPDWFQVAPDDPVESVLSWAEDLDWPVVFKPIDEGSAVGVRIWRDASGVQEILGRPRSGRHMLERYVAGRELTLPVVGGIAYEIVEIRPKDGFYDYEHKYTPGRSEYDCPADLPEEIASTVRMQGLRLASAIGLLELCRIDFRLDASGQAYVLEANSVPGMTATSLLPMGAAAQGIDFATVCERLCQHALQRDQ